MFAEKRRFKLPTKRIVSNSIVICNGVFCNGAEIEHYEHGLRQRMTMAVIGEFNSNLCFQ